MMDMTALAWNTLSAKGNELFLSVLGKIKWNEWTVVCGGKEKWFYMPPDTKPEAEGHSYRMFLRPAN